MMRQLAVTGLVVVLIASCGSSDAAPEELAQDLLESCAQGDSDAMGSMLADQGVLVFEDEPEEPFWDALLVSANEYGFAQEADFDGDGEETLADLLQAQCALFGGVLDRSEVSCEATGPDTTTCSETQFTRFGGAGYPFLGEFTFADGRIVQLHQLPVDPVALQAGFADWAEGMRSYRSWVRAEHPESYDDLFLGDMLMGLPESLELNHELMDEYFADS